MFIKKIAAGILIAGTIVLSSSFTFAAPDNGTGCPENKQGSTSESPADPAKVNDRIKKALDSLVRDGTISREQENAVIKAFEAKRAQFEKAREELKKEGKLKDGSGKHPSKHSFRKKHGVLKELVDDGVITSEQADAIRKAIRGSVG